MNRTMYFACRAQDDCECIPNAVPVYDFFSDRIAEMRLGLDCAGYSSVRLLTDIGTARVTAELDSDNYQAVCSFIETMQRLCIEEQKNRTALLRGMKDSCGDVVGYLGEKGDLTADISNTDISELTVRAEQLADSFRRLLGKLTDMPSSGIPAMVSPERLIEEII